MPTERSSAKESPQKQEDVCPPSAAVPATEAWFAVATRGAVAQSWWGRGEASKALSEQAQGRCPLCLLSLGSLSGPWWMRMAQQPESGEQVLTN